MIDIGAGITIGPGITIGQFPVLGTVDFVTEGLDNLISETGDQFIEESFV
jgi:hypothetical protein